jgi:transcriptional regulator with XRE-family HTH domain
VARTKEGEIFGQTVRQLRASRRWTQEDLADAAGLTATYVGQVERGDKVPSLTVVLKLARGFGIAPDELLVGFSSPVLRQLKF